MSNRSQYTPGPANVARVEKDGETWKLVLVRELRHAPDKVWRALTDPAQIREWAPFEADASLGAAGTEVNLSAVGAPHVTSARITQADEPKLLEYTWGDHPMRWELEPAGGGTRLTLWTVIPRSYIAMGAAGWHICLDVLDHLLAGDPIGRMAGPAAMQFEGWKRLHAEYAQAFGLAGN
jgi:uncharacterized protein YndB with AHSA1/START domain